MKDYSDEVNQLLALWKSSRNKFSSFYHVLKQVQDSIGPDEFGQWCIDHLKLHIGVIDRVANVLRDADALREKQILALAKEAQRQKEEAWRAAKAQERRNAEEKRKQEREDIRLRKEADADAKKKIIKNKKRSERRAEKKETLQHATPTHEQLAKLLANCEKIEKTSRVDLGEQYAAMKEIVDSGQAGKDADGKLWVWTRWAKFYIKRSERDIRKCVDEYRASCPVLRDATVLPFPKIVA
jgi:hypothetical protein